MKTLCVTGINPLALTRIFQTLQQAGLTPAHASGRDSALNLNVWHDQAMSLIDIQQGERINTRTGRFLEHIADDIVAANLGQPLWGWEDTRSVWLLDFWLAFDPRIQFLLVMTRPEQMLAQTLLTDSEAQAIHHVLEQWQLAHQALLRFHHRHPDRSLLVQDEQCLEYPEAFLERCVNQWQLELVFPGPLPHPGLPQNPVALHLAREHCHADPEIRALYQELTASVLPLVDESELTCEVTPSILDSFQHLWRQLRDTAQALDIQTCLTHERQAELDDLTQEKKRLEQQKAELIKARDEQNKLAADRQAQIEQVTQARDEQAKLATDRQAQVTQLTQARDEQAKLATDRQAQITQLTQARDEQAQLATDRQAQITQLTQARDEQAQLATDRQAQITQLTQARDEQAQLATDRQTQLDKLSQKSRETEQENELLLLQLHQVQEELEHYFLKHQDAQQQVQRLETIEERFTRMRQQVPDYCGFGGVELDRPKDAEAEADVTRLNWRLLQLDITGRYFPKFEFDTFVEYGVAGLVLPRQSDNTPVLVRWPVQARQEDTVWVIPVCSQSNASYRMEILADLSTTDWNFLKMLSRQLHFIVSLPHTQQTLAELIPQSQVSAFHKLVDILQQFQPVFRYDQVALEQDNQEHLSLRFDNPSWGHIRWPLLTINVLRSSDNPALKPHLVLTIPVTDARPVLAEWFKRHEDAECLTVRIEPEIHARSPVWQALSAEEKPFVTALIKRFPAILRTLESSGAPVARAWADWIDLAETARDVMTQKPLAAPPPVPVQAPHEHEPRGSRRSSRTASKR